MHIAACHTCWSSKKEDCVKVRMHSNIHMKRAKKQVALLYISIIHQLCTYNGNKITALFRGGKKTLSHTHTHTQDHLSNTSVDKLRDTILISYYLTSSYSLTHTAVKY